MERRTRDDESHSAPLSTGVDDRSHIANSSCDALRRRSTEHLSRDDHAYDQLPMGDASTIRR